MHRKYDIHTHSEKKDGKVDSNMKYMARVGRGGGEGQLGVNCHNLPAVPRLQLSETNARLHMSNLELHNNMTKTVILPLIN